MQHCCFSAAVSQAPGLGFILILGSYLTTVEINNEISTLFFGGAVLVVVVTFKIKTRGSLILIII